MIRSNLVSVSLLAVLAAAALAGCGDDDDDSGFGNGGAGGSAGSGGSATSGGAAGKSTSNAGDTGAGGEPAGSAGQSSGGAAGTPSSSVLSSERSLALGTNHSCALDSGGVAYCWGDNADQQLGTGLINQTVPVPTPVETDLKFKAITAGESHTCAIATSGETYCWGANDFGQVGAGMQGLPRPITLVQGDIEFVAIAAGAFHTCGISAEGDGYCWGRNDMTGALGDGSSQNQPEPTPVASSEKWLALAAGGSTTVALTDGGLLQTWGANDAGQLGIGSSDSDVHSDPAPADSTLEFVAVTAGQAHGCAATAAGDTYCWGADDDEQLGNGADPASSSPAAVSGGRSLLELAAGTSHSCGLTGAGAAYCWGSNVSGNLGDGTGDAPAARDEPYAVDGNHVFVIVAAGGQHSCAVDDDGKLYCWGSNASGELGTGASDSLPHTSPELIADFAALH